jgi:2-amino-4-hydroxy-6-hydroxymethyldihydropteridine diphosphokinase
LHKVYLLTGSNLGDKKYYLDKAKRSLDKGIGTLLAESSIYESEPWGFVAKDTFFNQILLYETELSPHKILKIIQKIETQNGRVRLNTGYSSRNLDIDILFYDNLTVNSPDLIIPHPKLHERKFTLLPLSELAPDMKHPILNITVKQMLAQCKDIGTVSELPRIF